MAYMTIETAYHTHELQPIIFCYLYLLYLMFSRDYKGLRRLAEMTETRLDL